MTCPVALPPPPVNLVSPHHNVTCNVWLACYLFCPTDKTEGNKFAKDFEENSQKLQEFVSFLEKELKSGPPLLDALRNADIFYEMQYKEVKIVANVSVPSHVHVSAVTLLPWLLFHPPTSCLRLTTHLPTAWPASKGNWILSSRRCPDPRTPPSPRPPKTPPLPLAQTRPSWDWGPAEPRWTQSWTVRPWMTERDPTRTETLRTWTCLRRRPGVLLQQRVGANSDESTPPAPPETLPGGDSHLSRGCF